MSDAFQIKKIAEVRNGFCEKFGIPRQSGLCESVKSQIVFEPEYRIPEAFRGLEDFSHIWIIWQFSEAVREDWSPTVRPPRLGGNKRVGVFATRSPFRPNSLALSCVKLEKIEFSDALGPVLHITGADLLDKTPIFDIKPYIPYADCKQEATNGFTSTPKRKLKVEFSEEVAKKLDNGIAENIREIISEDPRPAYQNENGRIYKFRFLEHDIEFTVCDGTATVISI